MLQTSLWLFVSSLTSLLFGANNFLISLNLAKTLCFIGLVLSVIFFIASLVVSTRYTK